MHPRLGQVWCEMVGDVVLSNVMNIFPIVSNIWPSVAFLSPLPARGSAHMFSPSHQQGGKRSYHYLPYAGIHIGASVWYSHPVLYRRYVLKCEIFFLYSCLTLLFCATATSTVENETFCFLPTTVANKIKEQILCLLLANTSIWWRESKSLYEQLV